MLARSARNCKTKSNIFATPPGVSTKMCIRDSFCVFRHFVVCYTEQRRRAAVSAKAYYHLPGLFEFYEFYRAFLPDVYKRQLMNGFGLDENRKLRTFSKGMKKQVSVI